MSQLKPDEIDMVVCGDAIAPALLPAIFHDNCYGKCADCGSAIMWRPYCPPKAAKICFGCADARIRKSGEAPQVFTSIQAISEMTLMGLKPEGHC